ncbi:MAG: gfo/Idh/MocA family oxidoreductase [Rhodothermaceae bacterium TMED105]|nr:MAG: gfo/Idh/MocA family oxidoreductase [Rhodothermaceae bacterium TMED105]|tara:strand:+ start:699 stop:1853 length:1155 start_codon:yes stop_codon:yes gene_type:complete
MSKIRLAMVGGGQGAFIGAVHRTAAWIDGQAEFVAGSFSSNPEKCKQTGQELFIDPDRVYDTYSHMIEAEASKPEDERIHAVSIVTPNHLHAAPALEAMAKGFHVIVDKPMAFSVEEAIEMEKVARQHNVLLAVTHTYSGYPMIKEMKHRIAKGELGAIRKIYVEYPQGWLSTGLEQEGQKQASWRTDPSKSGAGGAVGDIGTHAAHLAEYVAGSSITHVAAELGVHVEGRRLDDDAAALLRFEQGATGVLMATQVAAGEENTLKLRIYGEKGGFEWSHADANSLLYKPLDAPMQILRTGNGYLCEAAAKASRIPPGHPEGYLEAFANLYTEFFQAIRDHQAGKSLNNDFPDGVDGVHGLQFIDAMIRSSHSDQKWTEVERYKP